MTKGLTFQKLFYLVQILVYKIKNILFFKLKLRFQQKEAKNLAFSAGWDTIKLLFFKEPLPRDKNYPHPLAKRFPFRINPRMQHLPLKNVGSPRTFGLAIKRGEKMRERRSAFGALRSARDEETEFFSHNPSKTEGRKRVI